MKQGSSTFGIRELGPARGFALLSLLLVLGCSGRSQKNGTPNTAGGTGGMGAVDVPDDVHNFPCELVGDCGVIGDREEPLPSPECPVQEPAAGAACESEGLQCTFGSSVTAYCRSFWQCTDGVWSVPPGRDSVCRKQPSGQCPARPQSGTACRASDVDGFVPCEYEAGVACYCLGNPVGVPGSAGQWECYGPPRNGACPELLPNLGDGCKVNGLSCHYGITQQGCYAPYADVYCYRGAWESAMTACSL